MIRTNKMEELISISWLVESVSGCFLKLFSFKNISKKCLSPSYGHWIQAKSLLYIPGILARNWREQKWYVTFFKLQRKLRQKSMLPNSYLDSVILHDRYNWFHTQVQWLLVSTFKFWKMTKKHKRQSLLSKYLAINI